VMVGVGGETAIVVSVGFTKKPLQPAPTASATNPAKASANVGLRPVNIANRLGDLILAERQELTELPLVQVWSRTDAKTSRPTGFILGT